MILLARLLLASQILPLRFTGMIRFRLTFLPCNGTRLLIQLLNEKQVPGSFFQPIILKFNCLIDWKIGASDFYESVRLTQAIIDIINQSGQESILPIHIAAPLNKIGLITLEILLRQRTEASWLRPFAHLDSIIFIRLPIAIYLALFHIDIIGKVVGHLFFLII